MGRESLPDLGIVLYFLREGMGWSQTELGEASGVSPNQINDYERGRKKLNRGRLEFLISFMGLGPERIDAILAELEATRAAARPDGAPSGRFEKRRRHIETIAAQVGRLATAFARSALTLLSLGGESLHARDRADALWQIFKRKKPAERLALVESDRRFRVWGLVVKVCEESREAAANEPKEALELARLAVRIAELVPGRKEWRWRLQGLATGYLSNALRTMNDLPAAEQAIIRSLKLWQDGAPGDPGLLNPAVLLAIEAVLRCDQRHFPLAKKRIEEALDLDNGELRGKILLTKSNVHDALGETEESTAALLEAAPLIDAEREPRLAFGLEFNLLDDLCDLGRAEEARDRVVIVRKLAERLGGKLDLNRVVWLEGKISAGFGQQEKALGHFEQVRSTFHKEELSYDYALVSLDLSLIHLEQGNTAEVRIIGDEMFWIFRRQLVHREALAALRVFCEAAGR
ncbi:MAG TPA: helix-turn-helix transcriptional regulator, partial [Thermoanaerobaculia bacterium]|nr:helix-turn-helix transcriptional regulator [Thermoanaerobaculia bacterium]